MLLKLTPCYQFCRLNFHKFHQEFGKLSSLDEDTFEGGIVDEGTSGGHELSLEQLQVDPPHRCHLRVAPLIRKVLGIEESQESQKL